MSRTLSKEMATKIKTIPTDQIFAEFRTCAVAWNGFGASYHIWDTHKLASDFQNAMIKTLRSYIRKMPNGRDAYEARMFLKKFIIHQKYGKKKKQK